MKTFLLVFFLVIVPILFSLLIFFGARRKNKDKGKSNWSYNSHLPKIYETKGERGERFVSYVLGETIPGVQYIINDLRFYDKSNKTRQIDHVYINKSGIWVIETKNYSGKIYGMENQHNWTQVVGYKNTSVNKFYNPIKQNLSHIYALSDFIKPQYIMHNVVVFLEDADISDVCYDEIYTLERLNQIKGKETGINISVEQMETYYNNLLKINDKNITLDEHVTNIIIEQDKIEQGICPRCGGALKLRNGKYGQFYGCSNYPNCKFKKQIEE